MLPFYKQRLGGTFNGLVITKQAFNKLTFSISTNGREEECVKDIGGKYRRKETIRKNKT
jgi:hypothetical protein